MGKVACVMGKSRNRKAGKVEASVEAYINLTSLVSYLSFSRPCDSE